MRGIAVVIALLVATCVAGECQAREGGGGLSVGLACGH